MSNPSFENIDRWLFELVEGNLTDEQIQQLEAFLIRHPELDVDRDVWELAKVDATLVSYPHANKLVRRRPVGLYMMAGFVSMAIFTSFGVYTWWNTDLNSSSTIISSNLELDKVMEETADLKSQISLLELKDSDDSAAVSSNAQGQHHDVLQTGAFKWQTGLLEGSILVKNKQNKGLELTSLQNSVDEAVIAMEVLSENLGITYSSAREAIQQEEKLATAPAKPIESHHYRNWNTASSHESSTRFSHQEHKESFSSRLQKAQRMVQRMMDYPVALKNLKDPYYHIPGLTAMDVNFGSVGTLVSSRVQTLSRMQWLGEENQQMTNMVAMDGYVYSMRGGVGFQMSNSWYGNGQIMNNQLAFTYSPKFSVNRNILIEPAVRIKMGNKMLDENKIDGIGLAEFERGNVHEFYPIGTLPTGKSLWYRDMGAGVMVNTKWFYTGLQVDNLFRHYDNVYSGDGANERRSANHIIATIGTDYESKRENIGLSPYVVYQKNEALSEFWFGLNTRFNWLTAGGAISDNLDLVASLGLKFNCFAVNYNIDLTSSAMSQKHLLSHQLSMRFVAFDKYGKNKRLTF